MLLLTSPPINKQALVLSEIVNFQFWVVFLMTFTVLRKEFCLERHVYQ